MVPIRPLCQKIKLSVIDIGSYLIHIADEVFREVHYSIKLVCYLDEAAVELHCFFKWSAACCEDCKRLEYIIEIIVHFMKEHMESW